MWFIRHAFLKPKMYLCVCLNELYQLIKGGCYLSPLHIRIFVTSSTCISSSISAATKHTFLVCLYKPHMHLEIPHDCNCNLHHFSFSSDFLAIAFYWLNLHRHPVLSTWTFSIKQLASKIICVPLINITLTSFMSAKSLISFFLMWSQLFWLVSMMLVPNGAKVYIACWI